MSSCCCSTNATGSKKVVDAHIPTQAPSKNDTGSLKKPKKSSKHTFFVKFYLRFCNQLFENMEICFCFKGLFKK